VKNIFRNNHDVLIFSGGMPKASFGDRYTVTLQTTEKVVVLDFESPVLGFVLLQDYGGLEFI
jgi:hypothetical protein